MLPAPFYQESRNKRELRGKNQSSHWLIAYNSKIQEIKPARQSCIGEWKITQPEENSLESWYTFFNCRINLVSYGVSQTKTTKMQIKNLLNMNYRDK